jgi:hypothetical protein
MPIRTSEGIMPKLKIHPMMWKHSGPIEHIDENIVRCSVEPLPKGIAAYITREAERWTYDTAVDGSEPVESEARFNSAPEAATGLEEWLANHAVAG